MLEGYAVGGPLNNIKLTAPDNWDGRVKLPSKSQATATRYHPGKYKWKHGHWTWKSDHNYCDSDWHRFAYGARRTDKCYCGKVKMQIAP